MAQHHIQADNISFSYDHKTQILSNVNFTIKRNEVIAFIGPNGGGKTTLLHIIAGLLKPDAGHMDVHDFSNSANMIGYVPQYANFDKQFPMTVFDVVLSGLIKSFGFYSRKDKQKAHNALKKLDLVDLKDRPISDLSGGQMQRTLIARALASPKEILLLDEPTANIDQQSTESLTKLLGELSHTLTIILVTHDVSFLYNNADRIFRINHSLEEVPIQKKGDVLQIIESDAFLYANNNHTYPQAAVL